ncbi:MAG: methyltransferase domain-containing protein [Pirellulaceae bacterium]|nr:methyltransferase domain-containing protein [Pirellulaceae bacterium]
MNVLLSDSVREECQREIVRLSQSDFSVAQARSIQNKWGSQLGSIVLSSAALQKKAQAKLGEGVWWVNEKSLQQATPHQVAKLKSQWFADGPVADLCCGIGGDAVHLANRHHVIAIDHDPEVCQMAHANLVNHVADAVNRIEVVQGDVTRQNIATDRWLHIDPDRRSGVTRSTDPNDYSPTWDSVIDLITRAPGAIVKLAPAADIALIDGIDSHRVWISLAGTVREQSLLCGEMRNAFAQSCEQDLCVFDRSAIVVDNDGSFQVFTADSQSTANSTDKPLDYMVDPDAAIRAAGLTEGFANSFGCQLLGGPSGFLTGDDAVTLGRNELAIVERVVWTGSCDDRRLRRELRARDFYPKRIKTRGVSHDPNKLEKKLRQCGEYPITLWIGRTGKGHYAAITRPIEG